MQRRGRRKGLFGQVSIADGARVFNSGHMMEFLSRAPVSCSRLGQKKGEERGKALVHIEDVRIKVGWFHYLADDGYCHIYLAPRN